jgi:hypothetical protein
MPRASIKIEWRLVGLSAATLLMHCVVSDRSVVHGGLLLLAWAIFVAVLGLGIWAYRQAGRTDERRSRFLEPAVLALVAALFHALMIPTLP